MSVVHTGTLTDNHTLFALGVLFHSSTIDGHIMLVISVLIMLVISVLIRLLV